MKFYKISGDLREHVKALILDASGFKEIKVNVKELCKIIESLQNLESIEDKPKEEKKEEKK